jgi:hypothetical protein
MNRLRRKLWRVLPVALLTGSTAGCGQPDPRIGLVLIYRAVVPVGVIDLWFDEIRMLRGLPSILYVSPLGAAHEARGPLGGGGELPEQVRVRWRYRPAGYSRDSETWPEAEATAPLRSAMVASDRLLLRREADRRRLSLSLVFDHDRFSLEWDISRWR